MYTVSTALLFKYLAVNIVFYLTKWVDYNLLMSQQCFCVNQNILTLINLCIETL